MVGINQIAERDAKRTGIICGEERVTFGQWLTRAIDLGRLLRPHTPRRIVFMSENRPELLFLATATNMLNACSVGIDNDLSQQAKLHCVRLVDADVIVYTDYTAADAEYILAAHEVASLNLDKPISRAPSGQRPTPALDHARGFEAISLTSGTTGNPKAVYRTKSFAKRRNEMLIERFGFNENDCFLSTIPYTHASTTGWTLTLLAAGGTVVIPKSLDAKNIARDIHEHNVTALLATPRHVDELERSFSNDRAPVGLRFVVTGGKHLPRDLAMRWRDNIGPSLHEYYGTTETGLNTIATSQELIQFPGSCGQPLPGTDIAIINSVGSRIPDGEAGHVAVCGFQNMDRYLGDTHVEAVEIDGRRFLVTADIGRVVNGRLYVHARSFGAGTAIDLYAIEDCARCALPCVGDACAVRRSCGNGVDLYLVLNQPVGIADRLASLVGDKVVVHVRNEIPYGPTGKVQIERLIS